MNCTGSFGLKRLTTFTHSERGLARGLGESELIPARKNGITSRDEGNVR
jgi:hypothetical protein